MGGIGFGGDLLCRKLSFHKTGKETDFVNLSLNQF